MSKQKQIMGQKTVNGDGWVQSRFMQSYGAWTVVLNFFGDKDKIRMQALNRYMYHVGVSRVQTRIRLKFDDVFFWRMSQERDAIYTLSVPSYAMTRTPISGDYKYDYGQRMV